MLLESKGANLTRYLSSTLGGRRERHGWSARSLSIDKQTDTRDTHHLTFVRTDMEKEREREKTPKFFFSSQSVSLSVYK